MQAKTIFLTDKEAIVYENMFHNDNHEIYREKYYSNLKVTDYLPILLIKMDNCVIDLSKSYSIGVVYLPVWMSDFQKAYFNSNKEMLDNYKLYLNGHSLEEPILIDDLINLINLKPNQPINPKEKKLIIN